MAAIDDPASIAGRGAASAIESWADAGRGCAVAIVVKAARVWTLAGSARRWLVLDTRELERLTSCPTRYVRLRCVVIARCWFPLEVPMG